MIKEIVCKKVTQWYNFMKKFPQAKEADRVINVTICDDDHTVIESCKEYAQRFAAESSSTLEWQYLTNISQMQPETLAKEDILILDIQMGTLNGIDLAREIRKYNEQVIVIFSTNYLEYALQGYEVAAFRYLKKPMTYQDFSTVMEEALARYHKSSQASIVLRCGYQTEQFRVEEIMYCETEMGHVKLTLQDSSTAMANIGISTLEEKLSSHSFFRCHKGCLVNLNYVKQPQKADILMKDGRLIPISRHRRKDFMTALMKHWGERLR